MPIRGMNEGIMAEKCCYGRCKGRSTIGCFDQEQAENALRRPASAGVGDDELRRNAAIADRLQSFHRNSCYPYAFDTEVADCVMDILAIVALTIGRRS